MADANTVIDQMILFVSINLSWRFHRQTVRSRCDDTRYAWVNGDFLISSDNDLDRSETVVERINSAKVAAKSNVLRQSDAKTALRFRTPRNMLDAIAWTYQ